MAGKQWTKMCRFLLENYGIDVDAVQKQMFDGGALVGEMRSDAAWMAAERKTTGKREKVLREKLNEAVRIIERLSRTNSYIIHMLLEENNLFHAPYFQRLINCCSSKTTDDPVLAKRLKTIQAEMIKHGGRRGGQYEHYNKLARQHVGQGKGQRSYGAGLSHKPKGKRKKSPRPPKRTGR